MTANPNPIDFFLRDLYSTGAFQAVITAIRFGVFDSLGTGPKTPITVARMIHADPHATGVLLEVLVAFGYLRNELMTANPNSIDFFLRDISSGVAGSA